MLHLPNVNKPLYCFYDITKELYCSDSQPQVSVYPLGYLSNLQGIHGKIEDYNFIQLFPKWKENTTHAASPFRMVCVCAVTFTQNNTQTTSPANMDKWLQCPIAVTPDSDSGESSDKKKQAQTQISVYLYVSGSTSATVFSSNISRKTGPSAW